ncbi:MAG: hypothetical protein ACO20W_10060, partial [Anaerohalosphaeraceae bacterium]
MHLRIRETWNRLFTTFSAGSIVILIAALLLFLVPMLSKGLTAVIFRETVEFRKMQAELFDRGNPESLQEETEETEKARQKIYAILDEFSRGIDTERLSDEVKDLYRDYGDELRYQGIPKEQYKELRSQAKTIRNHLLDAFETIDKDEIAKHLEAIESSQSPDAFQGTSVEKMFAIATDFRDIIVTVDLSRREIYIDELEKVKEEIYSLFGPRPEKDTPQLAMKRFGATRWDIAQKHLNYLLWQEKWVPSEDRQSLVSKQVRRDDPQEGSFAGTTLAPLFSLTEETLQ